MSDDDTSNARGPRDPIPPGLPMSAAPPRQSRRRSTKAAASPGAPAINTARDSNAPPVTGKGPAPGPPGHHARLRQRLLTSGPNALADLELLELVLQVALPPRDTRPMARALLARFGNVARILSAPLPELLAVEGLGEAGAAALKTVQAAAFRLVQVELDERPLLNAWERLLDYLTVAISHETVEHLHVLYLDTRNRLIADEAQGRGTVNHTPVYPREVVKRALELQATALILAHNHPSGDPTPSCEDIEMTREIKSAAAVFGIVLHDHLVLCHGRHVSFRREGLL